MRPADADLVELRLDLVDRPDVAGALHGRRLPGHRDLPRAVGGRRVRRAAKRSAAASSSRRWRSAPSTSTSRRPRALPPTSSARARAGASSCRRTSSAIRRRISRPATRACARPAPKWPSWRFRCRRSKRRCRCSTSARQIADEPGHGHVLIAMGNQGVPTRVLAARLRQPLDLRRRRRRARADAGLAPAPRLPVPAHRARRGALRRRRQPDHPFAIAGHAQRRLRGARAERGLRAARGARRRRLRRASRSGSDLRGASITAPFKIA